MEYNDGLASGGDRVALLRGRRKSEQQINDRYRAVREAYVMSHPESEAAYSLVQLDDRWGIAAIENPEPEVRDGRFGCKIAQDLKVMQLMSLQRMAAKTVLRHCLRRDGRCRRSDCASRRVALFRQIR